jgi:hypothetical protein
MSHLLLAFGFGNLVMLGWLAAAAAPLLIHLWSRHRFHEAPWAAMQFLLAAMRKNARRLQLQQWLLLALRTLIIAIVVLALADPYGERLIAGGSSVPTHKILVIDGSFSMDYRDESVTRFARAKEAAAEIVRQSRSADSFTVILMATPAKTILGRETIDHAAVTAEIDSLRQSHSLADLPGAIALVEEAIKRDQSDRRASGRYEVYFLTDLQRQTWQLDANAALHDRIIALSNQSALALIDIGQLRTSNLAITNLRASGPFVTTNRETTFEVTLHQFADEPRTKAVVELLVDGEPVSEQTLDIAAGSNTSAQFTYRFNSPGQHVIEARTSGDRLEIDNTRWLVVPVREAVRVLCIAGRADAARYVSDALNPNPADDSPIQPVVISETDLPEVDLTDFDCVFVCNLAQFTPGEAERLSRFAEAGGGVVFFLGDRVLVENYNTLKTGTKQPLIPVKIGQIINQPSFGLDPLEYRHPIVAPFRGRERAGLLTTPVARYHRLEPPRHRSDIAVAAALQNGDPFIVTAPLGRGRTILVATDGSLTSVDSATGEPWTNWPTWPSFLPLVRELLAYSMTGQQSDWQQLVGTPLTSSELPSRLQASALTTLKIERPHGQTAPVSIQPALNGEGWSYTDTNLSGIYTLRGLPDNDTREFAVNVDTTESELAKADPQQLPTELNISDAARDAASGTVDTNISRAGLNQSLLWIALAFMFVESFLAWQFGRGSA